MKGPDALAIDVGGTRIRAAIVTRDGQLLCRGETATPATLGAKETVECIIALSREVMGAEHAPKVVGICAPGPLDVGRGLALATPTIKGFDAGYPLRDRIAEALALPVFLDHDGHAAALAEWRFGAGRDQQNMVYITVSTGIGGGAIVDGRLQRGRMGMATHVGHMTVAPSGPICMCGNRGCWEALASGPALQAQARRLGFADGKEAFRAARAGEARAIALIADQARWLALGIVNLIHIYSPDCVVIGGGVGEELDLMRGILEEEIEQRALPPFRRTTVHKARLRGNAGLVGAALVGFDGLS